MVNKIVASILGNEKRMAKLSTLNTTFAREQAEKYVRAECLVNKVKLSESEIIKATVMIVG